MSNWCARLIYVAWLLVSALQLARVCDLVPAPDTLESALKFTLALTCVWLVCSLASFFASWIMTGGCWSGAETFWPSERSHQLFGPAIVWFVWNFVVQGLACTSSASWVNFYWSALCSAGLVLEYLDLVLLWRAFDPEPNASLDLERQRIPFPARGYESL